MSYTALDHPYVLTDEGIDELIALEAEGSAPVSSPGFESRAASPERLAELNALLATRAN